MSSYEIYVLILCLIVFLLLAGLSSLVIWLVLKQTVKLIRNGVEDENITKEYYKAQAKKERKVCKGIEITVSLLLCLLLCAFFAFSLYINFRGDSFSDTVPTIKVVNSSSMSEKHEKNVYLTENGLDDQFQTFDLILTYKVPDQFDLKLYDVVVYKVSGGYIIHRIVGIEEPNESHPNERYFLLQGDANETPDRYPVHYNQMVGIYRGQRVPFIGTFVSFMQSPAGWLCIMLIVGAMILSPILEKKILKEVNDRLIKIGVIGEIATSKDVKEEVIEKVNSEFRALKIKKDNRTFFERLEASPDTTKQRYFAINDLIERIDGFKLRPTDKTRSYHYKNKPTVKLLIKGKTLNAYLALDPKKLENTKYVFSDQSNVKKYASCPVRVKLTSDRQVKYSLELITMVAKNNDLEIKEKVIAKVNAFEHLKGKKSKRTFNQKLNRAGKETKRKYLEIKDFIKGIPEFSERKGEMIKAFRYKNGTVIKCAVKGKTLNVYLALNPKDFENTKYVFLDVSKVKKYSQTPMRVKITSNRQVKYAKELILELAKQVTLAKGVDL